ncbi:unnamed protein product [Arctogadus glacialis]
MTRRTLELRAYAVARPDRLRAQNWPEPGDVIHRRRRKAPLAIYDDRDEVVQVRSERQVRLESPGGISEPGRYFGSALLIASLMKEIRRRIGQRSGTRFYSRRPEWKRQFPRIPDFTLHLPETKL